MFRITLTFALLLTLVFQGFAQKMDLFDKLLFVQKGDTLPYRLLKPVQPSDIKEFPLIIFLHGAGERGNDNEVHIKHIREFAEDEQHRGKYPCFVIAPQCPKGDYWAKFDGDIKTMQLAHQPSKPMKMVIDLIEKICKEFPVDQSRIYITGLSMGGFGTWDLISRYPNKFAAAVPICGGGDAKQADRIKHIPVWAFHGAKDNIVIPEHSRKMITALQKAGALPGYTEYPDIEHDSWTEAYREPHLIHWLFKQKIGNMVK